MVNNISDRFAEVRGRIAHAASACGRDPSSITVIAVSKTFPAEVAADAVQAGATDLGENRVQEAAAKRPHVPAARWHLIGPLQRNKARLALQNFDVIHTIDRPDIVQRLEFLMDRDWPGDHQKVLVEVNVGRESQKAGVLAEEADGLVGQVMDCDHLDVIGLMAIPPYQTDPEASRPHFAALRELRDDLESRLGVPLPHLSMGMSHDFEIAIAEGSTMVRVGTAIFGQRG
jgi:pyridoxal phosphate enzyme (YggS family)